MQHHEIEAWALDIVGRVRRGVRVEDARVELKGAYPTPHKAARRLAGHANASFGAPVLWIIGLDEDTGSISLAQTDFLTWWESVAAQFDELAPAPTELTVPTGASESVVAVLFETNRAPFIVLNPQYGREGGGPVQREVPWREGTAVRTARRSDLVRILSPVATTPTLEILDADLSYFRKNDAQWVLKVEAYVHASQGVIVPWHRCGGRILTEAHKPVVDLDSITVTPMGSGARSALYSGVFGSVSAPETTMTIHRGDSQVIIEASGPLTIVGRSSGEGHRDRPRQLWEELTVDIFLDPVDTATPIRERIRLSYQGWHDDDQETWKCLTSS